MTADGRLLPRRPLINDARTPSFRAEWLRSAVCSVRRRLRMWRAFLGSLASEFYSLYRRIQRLHKTKPYLIGVQLGPSAVVLPDQSVVSCEATFARIRDTQCMHTSYPGATSLDTEIFLEGWERGARWAVCSIRSQGHRTSDTAEVALEKLTLELDSVRLCRERMLARLATKRTT